MTKSLVFDAGPIISLSMNNLLWMLPALKSRFGGQFVITESVRQELIDTPLESKRFQFEALQIQSLVERGVLEVYPESMIKEETEKILSLLNESFYIDGQPLNIVHRGEISSLAAACKIGSIAVVMDERTTRLLMEKPKDLIHLLSHKLKARVDVDQRNFQQFGRSICAVKIIRSFELVTIAFELGLLNTFVPRKLKKVNPREKLLFSLLWGIKLAGCAASEKELNQVLRIEKHRGAV